MHLTTPRLSPRQREYLSTVARLTKSEGYPPTIREIGEALGVSSTNAVNDVLKRLEAKHLITRRSLTARGLRLTASGLEEVSP